jgi:hypothetical protein
MKNKAIQERIDINLRNDLKEVSLDRIKNGLEKEMQPIKELTRMMRNAESYPNLLNELKTKPRKKDG